MILGAPAVLYPKSVLSFFPDGTEIDSTVMWVPITLPEKPSYQQSEDKRKLRFAEIQGADTDIGAAGQPFEYLSFFTSANRQVDQRSNSFKGFRAPTYCTSIIKISMHLPGGHVTAGALIEPPYISTDFRLFTFDGKERELLTDEKFFHGIKRLGVNPNYDYGNIQTVALGQWFRMQCIGAQYIVGTIYHTTLKINVERECRIYLQEVSNLSNNPTFAIIGGGQNFPVVAKAPNGGTLAVTNGGTVLRGSGNQEIILAHGRDFVGVTTIDMYVRVDVEVPYGL